MYLQNYVLSSCIILPIAANSSSRLKNDGRTDNNIIDFILGVTNSTKLYFDNEYH